MAAELHAPDPGGHERAALNTAPFCLDEGEHLTSSPKSCAIRTGLAKTGDRRASEAFAAFGSNGRLEKARQEMYDKYLNNPTSWADGLVNYPAHLFSKNRPRTAGGSRATSPSRSSVGYCRGGTPSPRWRPSTSPRRHGKGKKPQKTKSRSKSAATC